MSTGKKKVTNVNTFFEKNGLFELLHHKDGDPLNSYKSKNQEYITECTNCKNQREYRGTWGGVCYRCQYKVVQKGDSDEFEIVKPTDAKMVGYADARLARPAAVVKLPREAAPLPEKRTSRKKNQESDSEDDIVVAKKKKKAPAEESEESEDSDDDEIPTPAPVRARNVKGTKPVPFGPSMIEFLKETARKTSGDRIPAQVRQRDEEADADLDEEVEAPKQTPKKVPKKALEEVPEEVPEDAPEVVDKRIKYVELKPGQSFWVAELGILIVAK